MENTEIIFVCNSVNNKNVRANELKILEKHPEELYFMFGENNVNTKKRYYKDLETLNKDYNELLKIKADLEEPKKNKIRNSEIEEEDNYKIRSSKSKLSEE